LSVRDENTKARRPPIRRPMNTRTSLSSSGKARMRTSGTLATTRNVAIQANAARAAEAMANPFPMAAVVFPTESSASALSRASVPRPLISAIPAALSAMGP
jgi:hypothetical protein